MRETSEVNGFYALHIIIIIILPFILLHTTDEGGAIE